MKYTTQLRIHSDILFYYINNGEQWEYVFKIEMIFYSSLQLRTKCNYPSENIFLRLMTRKYSKSMNHIDKARVRLLNELLYNSTIIINKSFWIK